MQPSLEIITLYSPQGLFHLLSQKSSLRLPICEMEPLQHQGTRIHPLQAQGRKVLTPPEDSLLPATPLPATPYPSQLEFGDPTPHQACCKSLIMFISNAAFFFFFFCNCKHWHLQPEPRGLCCHQPVLHLLWTHQLGVPPT